MVADDKIKVWDLGVRIFHWSLVFFFVITYVSGEGDETLHAYAGYIVMGLILFRFVWGFVGTKYARFSNFLYGPKTTINYIQGFLAGKPKHYLGHNPVGGWMAVLLMLSVLGACWSGLELYAADGKGPLAYNGDLIIKSALANGDEREHEAKKKKRKGKADKKAEEFWKDIHEALANFALFLVILHVSGVIIASKVHQEKLIKAMIDGYKSVKKP